MKKIRLTLLALLTVVGTTFSQQNKPADELLNKDYLYEVVRHLYRWYLDETDAERIVGKQEIQIKVRERSTL